MNVVLNCYVYGNLLHSSWKLIHPQTQLITKLCSFYFQNISWICFLHFYVHYHCLSLDSSILLPVLSNSLLPGLPTAFVLPKHKTIEWTTQTTNMIMFFPCLKSFSGFHLYRIISKLLNIVFTRSFLNLAFDFLSASSSATSAFHLIL